MIPVTQFILGNSDPLLYPSEKMTNSIDEQIAFLQSQKQAINEAYRRNAIPNANNGVTQNQQVPTQGIWDAIDAEIGNVKEVIKDYIIKQLVSMGESSPAIRLLIPLAKRAITNNINSFDKFLKPIADKDGMIDIEGIFDEEMEIINNIDNFNFDIPFIGGGNISKGIISLEVPYVNKIVALNQTDLEVLKESLISLKTK
nr:MAG: hypothetical protein [Bacteriophage sp.]